MIRKIERGLISFLPPDTWTERVRKVVGSSNGVSIVSVEPVDSSELSSKQLDPRTITLTRLIETNTLIDPGDISRFIGVRDPNVLDGISARMSDKASEYIQEHKQEILDAAKVDNIDF